MLPTNILTALGFLLFGMSVVVFASDDAQAQDPEWKPELILNEVQECVETHFCLPERLNQDWHSAIDRIRNCLDSYKSKDDLVRDLNSALSLLKISHTKVYSLEDIELYELLGVFSQTEPMAQENASWIQQHGGKGLGYAGVGLRCELHDKRWIVRGVLHGSPAQKAGIRDGDVISKCNEREFHPFASFRDRLDQPVRLSIVTPDNGLKEIVVDVEWYDVRTMFLKAMESSAQVYEVQNKKLGYLRVWSYAGEEYHQQIQQILLNGDLSECDGLILDLRGGWGGAAPNYLSLFDSTIPKLQYTKRNQEKVNYSPTWNKPVVLLIDDSVRSGKEIFAYGFKKWQRGEVIGTTTAGAVSGGRAFKLSHGIVLYLAVLTCEVDGEVLEGTGVEPTIVVSVDRKSAGGKDPVIEKGLQVLRDSIP